MKSFWSPEGGAAPGSGWRSIICFVFSAQAQPYHLWQNQRKLGPDRCHFNPTCSIQNQLRKKILLILRLTSGSIWFPRFASWACMHPFDQPSSVNQEVWDGVGWGDGGAIVWPDLAANLLCAIATIPRFIAPRANPFFSDFFSRLKGF